MMVMDFADDGNLRKYLPKIIKENWFYKLYKLRTIITGLNGIHQQNLFIVIFMMVIF